MLHAAPDKSSVVHVSYLKSVPEGLSAPPVRSELEREFSILLEDGSAYSGTTDPVE